MARAVLSSMMKAMDTTMAVANLRLWAAWRLSFRCRSQALRTRERWMSVEVCSLAKLWLLVKTCMRPETVCSVESVRGSTVTTVSLKAWGRRFTRSSRPTMSLSVSLSSAFMPELSNSRSMCFMILAGDIPWMSSTALGLLPTMPRSPCRKGLQLFTGLRSQTFLMTLMKVPTCFATFGVLSMTTTGLDILMLCSSFRFICGCQQ
mmetsp:Transcript_21143/g.66886  ORF Transcript_21143/g.66886 Transcript_21143/m.66886 type:complete len:205 (+) Transcript_21143:1002-1616(+)